MSHYVKKKMKRKNNPNPYDLKNIVFKTPYLLEVRGSIKKKCKEICILKSNEQ